jgi:23S rRNA pseudouridine2604 synthase
MSELDLCSRREADRFIIEKKVLVKGVPAIVGMRVADNETDIVVEGSSDKKCAAVVLHKPVGYVSGQPEHGNVPAVKLLTKENAVGKVDDLFENESRTTLTGFTVAGRLDRDTSGLLVYCHSGVVAKKLVSSMGLIPKEYVVTLQPAHQPTREEKARGITSLPRPTLDLQILKKGGGHLVGDPRPLKSIRAKWLEKGEVLRLILREGRRRQIRRMCRELLGYHVVSLERTQVGPIDLKDLPVGKWRPLTKKEVDEIISRN